MRRLCERVAFGPRPGNEANWHTFCGGTDSRGVDKKSPWSPNSSQLPAHVRRGKNNERSEFRRARGGGHGPTPAFHELESSLRDFSFLRRGLSSALGSWREAVAMASPKPEAR